MTEFILWLIVCFISTFAFIYLFYKLSCASKKVNLSGIVFFICGVVAQVFINSYRIGFLNTISYFIFFPIMFYIINPLKKKDILFYVLTIWIYALCSDLIFMFIVMLINNFMVFDMYGMMVEGIVSVAFTIVFVFLANNSKIKKFTDALHTRFNDLDYIDIFIIGFLIFASIVTIVIFFNLNNFSTNSFLYIILVLFVVDFIILIKYKINNDESEKYLKTLKENNDFYIKMDDENRIFKHNLMARLTGIKSVSNKKAVALIDDYVVKTKKSLSYSKKIKNIPYGLNGIIYQKTYAYMEDINFKLTNKIDFDIFKVLNPRRYNVLVEKLVVSLDNAIEASLSSRNKVVVINLYDDEEYIYIEIKNSFAHTLDVDNLGSLNYSTKGKKRGLGLFSILRDNEASLKVNVVNNYFISLISARKQK